MNSDRREPNEATQPESRRISKQMPSRASRGKPEFIPFARRIVLLSTQLAANSAGTVHDTELPARRTEKRQYFALPLHLTATISRTADQACQEGTWLSLRVRR